MRKVDIYTDGGASPNPGKGAWAVVVVEKEVVISELSGAETETSNNRMEMIAGITALEWLLDNNVQGVIHTDSQYLKNGIISWIKTWKANGWRTASRQAVKNQDLWQRLDLLVSQVQVEWRWVKGHSDNKWNQTADDLVCRTRKELV